ncbi:hypothetical protein GCM10009846_23710 [Agrococcus versicolor]|uniref:Gram-positive cocci surface proteins LPxTG domain-containing protein n=1 Tax=Agrococcus versicolor TaxID=501482 RepID=A0ABN3AUP9_9MICO
MHRLLPTVLAAGALVLAGAVPAAAVSQTGGDASAEQLDLRTITRTIPIGGSGTVGRVAIDLVFQHVRETCAAPDVGSTSTAAYPLDIDYRLTSPSGTTVALITPGSGEMDAAGSTYSSVTPLSPPQVAVRLVSGDAAPVVGSTNAGAPESGTFTAAEPLDAFLGEPAAGDWVLTIADAFRFSPHCYASATLELGIAPTLATAPLATGVVGVPYAAALPSADPADAAIALAAGSTLPPGLTLAADGTLTGTPTASGTFAFSASASNADGTSAPVAFTVRIDAPPSLAGPATAPARIGEPFAYAPTLGAGSPAATVGAAGLPSWLSLDPATGALTGIPTGTAGDVVVTLTASNGVGPDVVLTTTITVAPGPLAGIVLTPAEATVATGDALAMTVSGVDASGNAVDVGGAVTLVSDGVGDVVDGLVVRLGSPGPRTVTATHAGGATDSSTITVVAAPPAPSAASTSAPAAPPPTPAATTPAATTPTAVPGASLPRTGADGGPTGAVVLAALAMLGAAVLLRRRSPRH